MIEVVILMMHFITPQGDLVINRIAEPSMEICQHHARQLGYMPVPSSYVLASYSCAIVEERTA